HDQTEGASGAAQVAAARHAMGAARRGGDWDGSRSDLSTQTCLLGAQAAWSPGRRSIDGLNPTPPGCWHPIAMLLRLHSSGWRARGVAPRFARGARCRLPGSDGGGSADRLTLERQPLAVDVDHHGIARVALPAQDLLRERVLEL